MSNLKQKHKEYLIKNEIKDLTDLVNYVEILRNTSNLKGEDRQMLFDFAFLITNEQLSLKSFFAETKSLQNKNPSREFFNTFKQNTSSPTLLEKIIFDVCDKIDKGEWEGFNNDGFIFENPIQSVEEINNSPTFMDEVLDSSTTLTEEPKFAPGFGYIPKRGKIITYNSPTSCKDVSKTGELKAGKKESQTVKKAPIFTFCKQMKSAIEEMAFRTEYGHNKYIEFDADYNNFTRVDNGDEEYGNAQFRHALGIGDDSELEHYVASAWDAVARLEIYLRNKVK